MKAKSTNKLVSLALALFMLLMSVPFSMLATTVRAEEASETTKPGTYVLNANDLDPKGEYKNTSPTKGTADYFTIHFGSGGRVVNKPKTFEDGFEGVNQFDFNGTTRDSDAQSGTKVVEFTTSGKAKVKIWFANGSDGLRGMKIWKIEKNSDGTVKTMTPAGDTVKIDKNETSVDTVELDDAGTYFIGCPDGTLYFYKIEVTETPTYTLNANDLDPKGEYKNTSPTKGTADYFTIHFGSGGRVVNKPKTFEDGFEGVNQFDFNGTTRDSDAQSGTKVVEFTTSDKAQVKIWFANGSDGLRGMKIWKIEKNSDGTVKTMTPVGDTVKIDKNETSVDTVELDDAGTYFIGCPDGTLYFYKIEVTEGEVAEVVKTPWADVKAPVITGAEQSKKDGKLTNEIKVTVEAAIEDGDKVTVTMLDKDGNELESQSSSAVKNTHELTFKKADASGTYTFKAELTREGEEEAKKAEKDATADFKLPLGTPVITSATSKGNGTVEVVWGKVAEATKYEVFVGGTSKGTTDKTTFMVTGLEVGKEYSITVKAIRDEESSEEAEAKTVTTTAEAQITWGYTYYGSSIDESGKNDGYTVKNPDDPDKKEVQMFSTGGKGKVATSGGDSIPFYYTAVPTDKNFTLRASVHIDSWKNDGAQQGFGLLAIDSIPDAPTKNAFLSNQYMLVVSKMEYWWDTEAQAVDYDHLTTSDKYEYRVGVGVNARIDDGSGAYAVVQHPLDTTAPKKGIEKGKYNILGNCTDYTKLESEGITTIPEGGITDFIFEIQKNNTGYFLTYYDKDGKTIIGQQKFYDPDALSVLDEDNVYVGFFAAREATATFTNIKLTTIDPEDDAPAEEKPVEKIKPSITVGSSSTTANSTKYDLLLKANVKGSVTITVGGKPIIIGLAIDGSDEYTSYTLDIAPGTNKIEVKFTPDRKQELPEFTELASTDPVTTTINVKYDTYFANQKNLYVSPKGTKGGNGGKDYPLDIYTAVSVVKPGQTIILMEGTYELTKQVLIDRGMDGTADNMINMIADPDAKTRPVLDFKGTASGLKTGGNYWYFQGFDVTNAGQKTPGFIVAGNNNTVDNVNAYNNTDTGIFIKAFKDSNDPKDYWPKNNLILNCTSHNNSDASYADADGFACKLTTGEGNVFDGCIAYNNADDGWDLYAKLVSGPISSVLIKNCVAYGNGYLEDGTNAGNGNGFKLGGENLPAGHKIINSVAFNNKSNGFTSNSCPDVIIENCTSFNNGYEKDTKDVNVTVYTNVADLVTSFSISGIISFRDANVKDINDSLKPQTQTVDSLKADNNYYWLDGKSVNKSGAEVTADMFESFEFNGSIARNADNTINMEGFLVLKDNAPADAGARIGATPSKVFTVSEDGELPPPTGFGIAIVVAVIAISAAAAIVLFKKRKSSK